MSQFTAEEIRRAQGGKSPAELGETIATLTAERDKAEGQLQMVEAKYRAIEVQRDALRTALELCEAERDYLKGRREWFAELTEIYRKAWQENHNALVRLRELAEPLTFEEMNMPVAEMLVERAGGWKATREQLDARREALGGKS